MWAEINAPGHEQGTQPASHDIVSAAGGITSAERKDGQLGRITFQTAPACIWKAYKSESLKTNSLPWRVTASAWHRGFSVLQTAEDRQITQSLKRDNQTFRPVAQSILLEKKLTMVTVRTTDGDKNAGIAVLSSGTVQCHVPEAGHIFPSRQKIHSCPFSLLGQSNRTSGSVVGWMAFCFTGQGRSPEVCLEEELCSGNLFRTTQLNWAIQLHSISWNWAFVSLGISFSAHDAYIGGSI